jgi:ketosteroid isomerase-like protein
MAPLVWIVVFLSVIGCVRRPDLESERAEIRTTDAAWAAAAAAKDADVAAEFLADDALMMPPNQLPVFGRDHVAQWMAQALASPGFNISWATTDVGVAASGDFAYSIGTNQIQMQLPDGTIVTDRGKGLTVWRKHENGNWKVVLDIFNSDLPVMPPAVSDTTAGQ